MALHQEVRRPVRLKELSVQLQLLHATSQVRFVRLAFWKLFNGDKIASFHVLAQPHDGATTLSEYFKLLESIRTPIIGTIHLDILIG
jgi:hypothetical protein